MHADTKLVREAFVAAGEKHFALARLLYRQLFGSNWGHAVLAFAYMKQLDDLVDEDPDAERALATIARHRQFMDDVYRHREGATNLPAPQRFGYPFFCFDRARGAPLRPLFECILASMAHDTHRRGVFLSAAALDAHVVDLGGHVIRFVLHFAAPKVALPHAFVEIASRAYLNADNLIDLEHDLSCGVINIPIEDFESGRMRLCASDAAVRRWAKSRALFVLDDFRTAIKQALRLERWALRLLAAIYLSNKRRHLRRFLRREELRFEAMHASRSAGAEVAWRSSAQG